MKKEDIDRLQEIRKRTIVIIIVLNLRYKRLQLFYLRKTSITTGRAFRHTYQQMHVSRRAFLRMHPSFAWVLLPGSFHQHRLFFILLTVHFAAQLIYCKRITQAALCEIQNILPDFESCIPHTTDQASDNIRYSTVLLRPNRWTSSMFSHSQSPSRSPVAGGT